MLVKEPSNDDRQRPTTPPRRRSPAVYALLTAAALAVLVMRHDYWFWDTPYPLLFGCLPVALWWQALVSLSACALMWLMVRFAWPAELEDEAFEAERRRLEGEGGGRAGGA